MRRFCLSLALVAATALGAAAPVAEASSTRPQSRTMEIPNARWDHRPGGEAWTRSALTALAQHGAPLVRSEPRDVAQWCPGYKAGGETQRRAFWVGFLSALAKHESTYRAKAVGGGGQWYGLLQILPGTARGYGCRATSGGELIDGGDNLSCAIRIMARTVPRDNAIAVHDGRWRGVAADWGPMRSDAKRLDMASWLRGQEYCTLKRSPRPVLRPAAFKTRRSGKATR
ncbi:transglycosylase SLT domain-containing protein [Roseovarius nanhaiticus]|uniref:Transglycosylase SLT domain-containing protein n=1 Tax=Roseovarius nanhaiticus TaxID=573024 RepID=A0A1N7G2G3_9RHOB|nr:transglycosylase SLT domain-containing protein [Roseovarius nanhaiticus]SEK39017.1 Transglycosylase SLT domain-containing protein [Roseovarius nanhaiticus]SIS06758.1 Transglycosylase SLT domain-containing protein [Roseovarius nanhaiticus]